MPEDNQFDESYHLSLNSVAIDNRDKATQLKITIKQSKTDPFRSGVDVYIGTMGDYVCPLRGILPYLALRGNHPDPLFIFKDDRSLTRLHFCTELNDILQQLHL